MTTLNVSLPEDLRNMVEREVKRGGFASHSEYIRTLIRKEHRRLERKELEDRLLARLRGDPAEPMSDADWHHIRKELDKRVARRRTK